MADDSYQNILRSKIERLITFDRPHALAVKRIMRAQSNSGNEVFAELVAEFTRLGNGIREAVRPYSQLIVRLKSQEFVVEGFGEALCAAQIDKFGTQALIAVRSDAEPLAFAVLVELGDVNPAEIDYHVAPDGDAQSSIHYGAKCSRTSNPKMAAHAVFGLICSNLGQLIGLELSLHKAGAGNQ
jgi:hypothetical protein